MLGMRILGLGDGVRVSHFGGQFTRRRVAVEVAGSQR
jgi:hypothetical protein